MILTRLLVITCFLCLFFVACSTEKHGPEPSAVDQTGALTSEWPYWGGDSGGQRFSPLDQINRSNVARLKRAWTYHTGDMSDGAKYPTLSCFEGTPILVNGVMYISTPFCQVIALDPETGEEIWTFDPQIDLTKKRNLLINRGVASWKNGGDHRIFYGTLEGDLWCLDARTGKPVTSFGEAGRVRHGSIGAQSDLPHQQGGSITSPPTIYTDLVIVGGMIPRLRAYDVHTGEIVWQRNKAPATDEPEYETWSGVGVNNQGSSFAWPPMSVDIERGILFVPTDSPTPDYYGGLRHGDNKPCNSILALNVDTGETIWQYQISHHDVWDYDLPAQPNLITVQRDGRAVPAVAVVTKQGFLFLFHRETGEPLFEIEKRPVEQSTVPGEKLSPIQPVPVAPPPYARISAGPEEYARVTREHEAKARKAFAQYKLGHVFSAPSTEGVVVFPGNNGGADWGGGCYDPNTGLYYVSAINLGFILKLQPKHPKGMAYPGRALDLRPAGGKIYSPGGVEDYLYGWFWDSEVMWPYTAPPWSTLTALDLNKGTIAWQVPLGIVESLAEKGITDTGALSIGGGIVTAGGLVFIGATNDRRFRAFDSTTGEELWVARIDGSAHAVPMTYIGRKTGKQYVVVAAGGGNKYNKHFSDALVAFALP